MGTGGLTEITAGCRPAEAGVAIGLPDPSFDADITRDRLLPDLHTSTSEE
jgi:hypothetical protein